MRKLNLFGKENYRLLKMCRASSSKNKGMKQRKKKDRSNKNNWSRSF